VEGLRAEDSMHRSQISFRGQSVDLILGQNKEQNTTTLSATVNFNGRSIRVTLYYSAGEINMESLKTDMEQALFKVTYLAKAFDLGSKTKSITINDKQELTREKLDGTRVEYNKGAEAVLREKEVKATQKLYTEDNISNSYHLSEKIEQISETITKVFAPPVPPKPKSANKEANVGAPVPPPKPERLRASTVWVRQRRNLIWIFRKARSGLMQRL
jgi:hypothetical protein